LESRFDFKYVLYIQKVNQCTLFKMLYQL
jgi:hypothetical protein